MDIDHHDSATLRLKSTVARKIGRGFSKHDTMNDDATAPFDRLNEADTQPHENMQKSVEGWVVFVRGLHEETTEDDLVDKFSEVAPLVDFRMPLDHRSGYVKGYALVKYANQMDAKIAVETLHESLLMDSMIQCDYAFRKTYAY